MIPVHDLIAKRYSSRIIDPNRSLEKEKILSLLEAARWAPSCFNNQPWRFIVSIGESLPSVKECLSKGNAWAKNAPLILTVTSKPDLDCQIKDRDYYTLGLGLAIENLLLQGISLGLAAHPIAGFSETKITKMLCIPTDYRVHALVIVGYPGDRDHVDEQTFEKEQAPRERKKLDEIVFWEKWE